MINKSLSELIDYALDKKLIAEEDVVYVVNRILNLIGGTSFEREEYTPHSNIEEILAPILDFADENGIICVLKDHHTAVAKPRSDSIYINQSGNSGMSTGGSGDVLDGVIASLLAQGCNPYLAATLGVYVHGLAGDIASEILSQYSLMASDIIDALPQIFISL